MAEVRPVIHLSVVADPTREGVPDWLRDLRALAASSRTVRVIIDETGVKEQFICYEDVFDFVAAAYPSLREPRDAAVDIWVSLTESEFGRRLPQFCRRCQKRRSSNLCTCDPRLFRGRFKHWGVRRRELAKVTREQVENLGRMPVTTRRVMSFLASLDV